MNQYGEFHEAESRFVARVDEMLKTFPCIGASVGVSRTPAVVDVMGGIGEDSGALVLTATAAMSFHTAVWQTAEDQVRIRFAPEANQNDGLNLALPMTAFTASGQVLLDQCRRQNAEWATPTLLTLQKAMAEGIPAKLSGGLCFMIQTDFPESADLGRHSVQAAAAADAIYKLFAIQADRVAQARICAGAITELTGLGNLRKAMTALCGPANGSLLQLRFHPHLMCETLEMPEGITVQAVSTSLSRPTESQRLIETRLCSEMGHRMIVDLQQQDGMQLDPNNSRLSAITPTEYVERYRDRMPSKITWQAFVDRFGKLRGLEDRQDKPKSIYKIRSRAEHHIYENRRVHDFVTNLVRSRRNNSVETLVSAGELMYASHWSHSQRCGIGGVETDRLVNFIRGHGPKAGLFGAKVTAGGEGGELVVLMKDDEQAHAALADAVSQAEATSQKAVHVFGGSLPGAASFEAPDLASSVNPAGAV
ncbi:MAG: hypothetical protein MI923_18145 [Phycisphaerales bacterium]|nr:hypothetical protein [Phycisphaerales bacterium]